MGGKLPSPPGLAAPRGSIRAFLMTTGSTGLCMAIRAGPSQISSTGTTAILSRTAAPSMRRPKTVYLPSR